MRSVVLFLVILPGPCLSQHLKINEIMANNAVIPDEDGDFGAWIELFNPDNQDIPLTTYRLRIDNTEGQVEIELPDRSLKPHDFFLIWLSGKNKSEGNTLHSSVPVSNIESVSLVHSEGTVVDLIPVGTNLRLNEVAMRLPDGGEFCIMSGATQSSPSNPNIENTPWRRIIVKHGFPPRDSSPNACLVYNDSIWVLAGYRYEASSYFSRADVYRSENGGEWELINDNPPYSPYSVFLAFQGRMWAIGDLVAHTSTNGVDWDTLATNARLQAGTKGLVWNDAIWMIKGKTVWKSVDGVNYSELTNDAPWYPRLSPGFVAFKNKLWLFGGGVGYGTPVNHYFQDVWSSDDGITWKLETDNAEWPGRYWFGYLTFDNKIWLFGGWNYYDFSNTVYGNRNDAWFTEDGVRWEKLPVQETWPARHAPLFWVKNGSMFVSSGYGGGGNLYNDVWQYKKLSQKLAIDSSAVNGLVYGGADIPFSAFATEVPSVIFSGSQNLHQTAGGFETLGAGSAEIKIQNSGDAMYEPFSTVIPIEIEKAPLTIVGPEISLELGKSDAGLTDHRMFSYSGFQRNDNENAIEVQPEIVYFSPLHLPPGKYPVLLEGGYAANYELQLIPGSLSIKPSDDIFVFPNPADDHFSILYGGSTSGGELRIVNSRGIISKLVTFDRSLNPIFIDVSDLNPGSYFYEITIDSQKYVGRLVVK